MTARTDLPAPPNGMHVPPAAAPWWRGTCRAADGHERDFVMRAPSEDWVKWHLACCEYTPVDVALDPEYEPADGAVWFFRSVPRAREMVGQL